MRLDWKAILLTLALLPESPSLIAAPPATAPATRPAPDFSAALQQLAEDDFSAREQAVVKLQSMLLDQTRRQTEIQELLLQLQQSLSGQLKQLALVTDPEAQARAAGLLETQQGVIRWTIEVMKSPPDQRKTLLAWGFKQSTGALVGKAFAQPRKLRLEAIKELAKLDDDGASWTLAQLLNDKDPIVRAQTMASVWDRKAAPDIVAALFSRALTRISADSENSDDNQPNESPPTIKIEFPGLTYSMTFSDPDDVDPSDDSPLATALLIHLQSPEVSRRLTEVIHATFKDNHLKSPNIDTRWVQNFAALSEKYELKAAVPMLAALALVPNVGMSSNEFNNKQYFWSNRTAALGALLVLTHQNPEDYKLSRMHDPSENGSPNWFWSVAVQTDEPLAIKKLHTWWNKSYKDYGQTEKPAALPIDESNKENEAENPATAPAADPSAPNPPIENLPHTGPVAPALPPRAVPPA